MSETLFRDKDRYKSRKVCNNRELNSGKFCQLVIFSYLCAMKQHLLSTFLVCLLLCSTSSSAQDVTDEQYQAALASITPEATYRIYTLFNGWYEGDTRFYLTADGYLTSTEGMAGKFVFSRTEGDFLFRSPGWITDANFTNPQLTNGERGTIVNTGSLHTNPRGDYQWEGQLWYKEGDDYAVRSTNANSTSWGAEAFWSVFDDNGDDLPEAGYSFAPQYVWRLEKVDDPVDPTEEVHERLTNLPHVYVNTFTGRNITSKTDYVYARMWYVDEEDNVQYFDSLKIRGRGNSTWNLAKKPYKLKFQSKEKLLGKGYANTKKWTMLANHADKTLIRNAVTSLMGERAGLKFNPAAKFVDLTLNGKYVGNYQISDQVDVRPHRVKITEQDYPLADTSDISGGYLLEADGFRDYHTYTYWDNEEGRYLAPDGFETGQQGVPVRIHYPEAEELDISQTEYIRDYINDFESHLFSSKFTDPLAGYRPMVDSMSLANWYVCTEISAKSSFSNNHWGKFKGHLCGDN